ncbi:MAG TPA: OmpA family protein, partial [Puia sp.]|nr:OmpA family protein [Puia sp.]
GSFEDENFCEAKIPCSPSGWYSVSNIPYGYQNNLLKTIDKKRSIALLVACTKEIRMYWQTMLLCPLEKNKRYKLEFYVYSPIAKFEKEYMGIYFEDSLLHTSGDTLISLTSPIQIAAANIRSYKQGWFQISLSFIAGGNQKYLLLGNISEQSNKQMLSNSERSSTFIEYYIDNISLTIDKKTASKCPDCKIRRDSLYIAFNKHTIPNYPTSPLVIATNKNEKIKIDTLKLGKINFNFNSAELLNAAVIKEYFGRVDASKTINSYNNELSRRRAASVKKYLIERLNLADRDILAEGKGKIKDNNVLENNRRVEIIIYSRN